MADDPRFHPDEGAELPGDGAWAAIFTLIIGALPILAGIAIFLIFRYQ